jgi:hypothetical protein
MRRESGICTRSKWNCRPGYAGLISIDRRRRWERIKRRPRIGIGWGKRNGVGLGIRARVGTRSRENVGIRRGEARRRALSG